MDKIAVIGAGIMGCGVSQNFAQKGYDVVLIDLTRGILEKASGNIERAVRFQSMFSKGEKAAEPGEVLSKIRFTTDYAEAADVDFLIENVTEDIEIKKSVYETIDTVCSRACMFGVNTSCISITEIASYTERPEKVVGIHFMNPVPLKKHVEVIKGFHTSEETLEETRKLLSGIDKECIVVNDYPGFVANRISHLFMNEASFVVQDQVASPQEVDDIFKKCYGHKMGPLETADLIGLDTVVKSLDILYQSFQDSKFRCCPLLKKMVHAGLLGRKTGKGFYEY